jgi:serine/threonine protein kinase
VTFLPDQAVERLRAAAVWPELPGGRYAALRPLGRGGMGTVYAAWDHALEREVAIKVSRVELDARLKAESRILARLEHPGIVPVHDSGLLADGRAFYVMKLVQGHTLADHAALLRDESARLSVFERVVEAVAFAHNAGVVHRDLKPSNIMIGRFGEVLVLDWGVARVVPPDEAPADQDRGLRIGTPGFMAPEQASGGAAAAGPAADVFSLGALLSWLIASGRDAPAPTRLRAIATKCQAERPTDRYATASDLGDDLALYRAGRAVSAHRDTFLEKTAQWFSRYHTFILLVLAYLIMRAALAIFQRR